MIRPSRPALAAIWGRSSAVVLAVAVTAACSPGASPNVTQRPSASQFAERPTSAESQPPTPEESVSSSATPSDTAPASSAGLILTVVAPVGAATSGFEPDQLEARADSPFSVRFENQDTGLFHNWVLEGKSGSDVDIGDTTFFRGPATRIYEVPALAADRYTFMCRIHPLVMTGTLIVD